VESCKSKYTTPEEIVDHLRSNYPDYHRTKGQQLLRFVNDALQFSNNTPSRKPNQNINAADEDDDDDDEEECRNSSRKRRKDITDESEARLQKMESLHIKTRMSKQVPSSSSEPASNSSEDGEDGAVSTSEDAIYSEKVEPAFDLMKDMLRNSYTGVKTVPVTEEKNVELDMGNSSKATITVNRNGGEPKLYRTTKIRLKGSGSGSNVAGGGVGDVEMKGKEGPMFKDLGGMKDILEELMMDIVSLCNPQLPRHLGVKPVTGILLHGPPGCGKTRLAHAIANETGLPFHHISATEVVSGVSGIAATFQL
ncbi:cell division control protein 48 C-like, partial [Trifolium medium]|nr:cell division control protein 48 C-like [Trifolium medium]